MRARCRSAYMLKFDTPVALHLPEKKSSCSCKIVEEVKMYFEQALRVCEYTNKLYRALKNKKACKFEEQSLFVEKIKLLKLPLTNN